MGRHAKPVTWASIDADERAAVKSKALGFWNGRYAGKHAGGLAGVAYQAAQRRHMETCIYCGHIRSADSRPCHTCKMTPTEAATAARIR